MASRAAEDPVISQKLLFLLVATFSPNSYFSSLLDSLDIFFEIFFLFNYLATVTRLAVVISSTSFTIAFCLFCALSGLFLSQIILYDASYFVSNWLRPGLVSPVELITI